MRYEGKNLEKIQIEKENEREGKREMKEEKEKKRKERDKRGVVDDLLKNLIRRLNNLMKKNKKSFTTYCLICHFVIMLRIFV